VTRLFLATLALGLASTACDGPPIPATFKDEPTCVDFKIGANGTLMRGGLRHPISLKVMEGSTVVAKGTLYGLRDPKQPTKLLVPSGNNEYTIEWSQCPNAYAPSAVDKTKAASREPSGYICGDAKPYKTDNIVTKADDPQSFMFAVPPPPESECWTTEAPAAPSAAPEPPPVPASASAEVTADPSSSTAPSAAPSSSSLSSSSALPSTSTAPSANPSRLGN
jgi:hypothetical protein